jgi:DNA-binding CsgD family transcriptional regulator
VTVGVQDQKWSTTIVWAVEDLTAMAGRLMSPVPEQRGEALLELLHAAGAADAGVLSALGADGVPLVVASFGRVRDATTRSLVSATGEYVGVLHLDLPPKRLSPRAIAAVDSLTPHAAAIAAVVSRRSRLGLTRRERDILCAIAEGYSNAEISARESVSVRTVTTHVESIFRKLGVRNRVQAARVAIGCCLQDQDYNAGLASDQGLAAS